jgi:hypothetical protein
MASPVENTTKAATTWSIKMKDPADVLTATDAELEEYAKELCRHDALWSTLERLDVPMLHRALYLHARLQEQRKQTEALYLNGLPPVITYKDKIAPDPKTVWKIMLSPPGSCHVIENGKLIGVASGSVNATRLGSTAYLSRLMVMGQRELPDWIVIVDHEDRILVQGNPREKSDSACFLESENTSVYTDIRIEQKTHELVFRPGSLDREYKPVRSCDDCDHSTVSKDNDSCRTCRNHSNWLAAMER